jgi:hypothetical protein
MNTALLDPCAETPAAVVVPMPNGTVAGTHGATVTSEQRDARWQMRAEADATLAIRWRRAAGSQLEPSLLVTTPEGRTLATTQAAFDPLGSQSWVSAAGPQAGPQSPTALQQAAAGVLKIPVTQGQVILIHASGLRNTTGAGELTIEVNPDPHSGPQPVVSPYTLDDTRKYLLSVAKPDHACNLFGAGIEVVAMTRLLLEATAVTAGQLVVFDTVTDEIVRQNT